MPDFSLVFLSQSWHGNTVGKKGYLLHLAHPCYLLAMRATGYESGMVDLRNSPQKKKKFTYSLPIMSADYLDRLFNDVPCAVAEPPTSVYAVGRHVFIHLSRINSLCYLFFCRWHHFSQTEESQNQSSKVRAVYSSKV